MLVDLLLEILLELAQEFQVGLRVEALHAPEVIREQTAQVLLLRAVQKQADVQRLIPHQVRHILDQEKGARFNFALFRHTIHLPRPLQSQFGKGRRELFLASTRA